MLPFGSFVISLQPVFEPCVPILSHLDQAIKSSMFAGAFYSSVAKICGYVFVVRTLVRFFGDESAYADHGRMNPLSTIFGQAHFIHRY
jgi:hypothetical protein